MQVLVVSAHPDDESAFAGGMIARLVSEGHAVHILWTTRGEGGEMGDPPIATRETLGAIREAEARAAAESLGAQSVDFLPYVDPTVGPDDTLFPIDATLDEFSAAIEATLADLRPDLLITHGSNGEYGHPQHVFTHRAVFAALDRCAPWQPREVLTWGAQYPDADRPQMLNKDDPADLVVDISAWMPQKIQAFAAHRTQHVLFFRHSPGKRLDEIPSPIESFRRWRSNA